MNSRRRMWDLDRGNRAPPPEFRIPPPPALPVVSPVQDSNLGSNCSTSELLENLGQFSSDCPSLAMTTTSTFNSAATSSSSRGNTDDQLWLHLSIYLMLGSFGLLLVFSLLLCFFRLCYCQRIPDFLLTSSGGKDMSDHLLQVDDPEVESDGSCTPDIELDAAERHPKLTPDSSRRPWPSAWWSPWRRSLFGGSKASSILKKAKISSRVYPEEHIHI